MDESLYLAVPVQCLLLLTPLWLTLDTTSRLVITADKYHLCRLLSPSSTFGGQFITIATTYQANVQILKQQDNGNIMRIGNNKDINKNKL